MKVTFPQSENPRVLIIGGGFGGIKLAKSLKKAPYQVVMVDRNNYHTFQPLLYQVATGGLEPDSIAFPLRKIFDNQSNFLFRMAEVIRIDPENKIAYTSIGEIDFDYLAIATGSYTNFFGNDVIAHHAMSMKSVLEAVDLRSMILQHFEKALLATTEEEKKRLMNFVVVGGGPTGVEMAGALGELKLHVLPHDYPELDFSNMCIHLIEGGPALLAGMSEKSSADALKSLKKFDVNVWLETLVKDYDGETVHTNTDRVFKAESVIWAAGIKANTIEGLGEDHIGRGSRYQVDEFNRLGDYEDIFVIGDAALMTNEKYPKGHPQVAQVAIQQGDQVAENLVHISKGAPLKGFEYFDKGSMATIGRNKAVVDLGKLHLKGFIAWIAWMFVHLLFLVGFRNKLVVFINWTWNYLTYDKGSRLIVSPYEKEGEEETSLVA